MLDHLITPFSSDTPVTSFPATTTIFPLLSLSTNSAPFNLFLLALSIFVNSIIPVVGITTTGLDSFSPITSFLFVKCIFAVFKISEPRWYSFFYLGFNLQMKFFYHLIL